MTIQRKCCTASNKLRVCLYCLGMNHVSVQYRHHTIVRNVFLCISVQYVQRAKLHGKSPMGETRVRKPLQLQTTFGEKESVKFSEQRDASMAILERLRRSPQHLLRVCLKTLKIGLCQFQIISALFLRMCLDTKFQPFWLQLQNDKKMLREPIEVPWTVQYSIVSSDTIAVMAIDV